MRRGSAWIATLVLALVAAPAAARGQAATEASAEKDKSGSVGAAAAAVFPGLVVPGVGHFVLGDKDAGKRFLIADSIGLGLIAVGFGGMAGTGGNDRLAPGFLAQTVAGMSLLTMLWLSDVIGSAHGEKPWPLPWEPKGSLSLSAGYQGLFGGQVDFHHGIFLDATWRYAGFFANPWGMVDPSKSFYGAGARLGYLLWRDRDDPVTRISLNASVGHRRYRFDRYSSTTGEVHGELRFNLSHLTPTLRNAYLLGRVGAGVEGFAYDGAPFRGSDLSPVLVLEFGGGVQVSERVGVELVYRNRKDELPGGLIIAGIFDSYLGFIELNGRVALTDRWAILGGLRWGTGLMPWICVESQLF